MNLNAGLTGPMPILLYVLDSLNYEEASLVSNSWMVLALSSENYAYGQLFVALLTASFKLDALSMNLEKNANYVYN